MRQTEQVQTPHPRSGQPAQYGASPPLPESLCRELEELGLSPSEARVTLTLLQLGSVKSTELARLSGVPRTSIYQVIEGLRDKGLVERLAGSGPAIWATPGRDRVLDRLHTALAAAQEDRLRQHAARTERLRDVLAEAVPGDPSVALPYVHLLSCPAEVRESHQHLMSEAEHEILVFNRPPYSTAPDPVKDATVQALERGVRMRVLYQAAQIEDPEADSFRAAVETYRQLGVEGRVVDELPTKLIVVDATSVLLAMDDPVLADAGFPVTIHVEHPGFATVQAAAFEQFWTTSRPLPAPTGASSARPPAPVRP